MVRVDLCVTVDYIIRVRVRILELKINIPLKFSPPDGNERSENVFKLRYGGYYNRVRVRVIYSKSRVRSRSVSFVS